VQYESYVTQFIQDSKDDPFFLYMPFSHVHTTSNTPEQQYADCQVSGKWSAEGAAVRGIPGAGNAGPPTAVRNASTMDGLPQY
jgi:hypothetical protein